MNPAVKPGDTIRVVRMLVKQLDKEYAGSTAVVDKDVESRYVIRGKFADGHTLHISEWELVEPTPRPDPLTHLTDHVGNPATLTVAGRTYTAVLAHAAVVPGVPVYSNGEVGEIDPALATIRVELADIKDQA